ncbi:hypothetical protein B7463_g10665, partial [Scytalidium lignicola]
MQIQRNPVPPRSTTKSKQKQKQKQEKKPQATKLFCQFLPLSAVRGGQETLTLTDGLKSLVPPWQKVGGHWMGQHADRQIWLSKGDRAQENGKGKKRWAKKRARRTGARAEKSSAGGRALFRSVLLMLFVVLIVVVVVVVVVAGPALFLFFFSLGPGERREGKGDFPHYCKSARTKSRGRAASVSVRRTAAAALGKQAGLDLGEVVLLESD